MIHYDGCHTHQPDGGFHCDFSHGDNHQNHFGIDYSHHNVNGHEHHEFCIEETGKTGFGGKGCIEWNSGF